MTQSNCSWSYKSQLLQTTCSKFGNEKLFFLYGFSFSICRDFHFYASAFNLWSFSALVVLPSILVSGKGQSMSTSSRFGAGSWKNKSLDWGSGNRMQMSIILVFLISREFNALVKGHVNWMKTYTTCYLMGPTWSRTCHVDEPNFRISSNEQGSERVRIIFLSAENTSCVGGMHQILQW